MYAKIDNQSSVVKYPYTEEDLRVEYRNVSFPEVMSDEDRAQFNMVRVVVVGHQEIDHTKNATQGMPVYVSERGRWEQTWIITDATPEQIAERTDNKANEVRMQRNAMISSSDWTQLDDTPITNAKKLAWATYRQALRDIPAQAGFPWEVSWPTQPE